MGDDLKKETQRMAITVSLGFQIKCSG